MANGVLREIRNEDTWAKQILFWRDHLDIFIEEYFGVRLKDTQKVIARQFGRCST